MFLLKFTKSIFCFEIVFQFDELTAHKNFDENVLISSDFLKNQQYCLGSR